MHMVHCSSSIFQKCTSDREPRYRPHWSRPQVQKIRQNYSPSSHHEPRSTNDSSADAHIHHHRRDNNQNGVVVIDGERHDQVQIVVVIGKQRMKNHSELKIQKPRSRSRQKMIFAGERDKQRRNRSTRELKSNLQVHCNPLPHPPPSCSPLLLPPNFIRLFFNSGFVAFYQPQLSVFEWTRNYVVVVVVVFVMDLLNGLNFCWRNENGINKIDLV